MYHHLCDMDPNISFLGDTMNDESFEGVSLCGLDPGRNQVFTAAYGDGETSHQVRRSSTKEYYTYTGSIRIRIAKREMERRIAEGMETAMLNMPTAKTASISVFSSSFFLFFFVFFLLVLLYLRPLLIRMLAISCLPLCVPWYE